MAGNNNGFADAMNQINTLLKVDKQVSMNVLEEAAEYFAEQLRPNIPQGYGPEHMRDKLKVTIEDDVVQVVFDDDAWYWFQVEHGHKTPKKKGGKKGSGKGFVPGRHFVRNTFDANGDKIAQIMADKIISKMEG